MPSFVADLAAQPTFNGRQQFQGASSNITPASPKHEGRGSLYDHDTIFSEISHTLDDTDNIFDEAIKIPSFDYLHNISSGFS